MKKLILSLLLLLCGTFSSYAQQSTVLPDTPEGKYRVYCELLGVQKSLFSTKLKVLADFGQDRSFWKSGGNMFVVDEEGNKITFNSMVDAMNYFGKYGWKFVQAYTVTVSNQNVYHWLLYKDVANEDEVREGIVTKADVSE